MAARRPKSHEPQTSDTTMQVSVPATSFDWHLEEAELAAEFRAYAEAKLGFPIPEQGKLEVNICVDPYRETTSAIQFVVTIPKEPQA